MTNRKTPRTKRQKSCPGGPLLRDIRMPRQIYFLFSDTVPVSVPASGHTLTLRTHIHCNSRWQPARELGDPQELECSGISISTGPRRSGSNDAWHTFSFSDTRRCHSSKGSGSFWSPNLNRNVKSSVDDFRRHGY